MEDIVSYLLLVFITFTFIYTLTSPFIDRRLRRLPPGPYPLPIIGNIHHFGKNPHHSLAKLSKIYGPIMSLKLGGQTTIVVSSPIIAKEILKKNDHFFSSRPIPDAAYVHDHENLAIVWLPASNKWRTLRKICKEQIFSVKKLDATQSLRQQKLKELMGYLHNCSIKKQAVKIGEASFTTTLNLISNTLFSVNFTSFDSSSTQEFKNMVCEVLDITTEPNLGDFFPILRYFDPQGIRRRSKAIFGKSLGMFEDIIKQRQKERSLFGINGYIRKQDVLETLIDEMEKDESKFGMDELKHLVLVLFVAGSDTASVMVEWVMAELLRNPKMMQKARNELLEVIGQKEIIDESDISKLPYLLAVVKETFRVHPSNPLLIPHRADSNVEIHGYQVPRNADVLINIWASGRDSKTWSNPDMFDPERFMESDIDMEGQHFELIPFGSGRRSCPGRPLGYRMVHLILAYLIRNFDWKLEEGMRIEDITLEEQYGVTSKMIVPLKAIPVEK